jgi:hypothetical protein
MTFKYAQKSALHATSICDTTTAASLASIRLHLRQCQQPMTYHLLGHEGINDQYLHLNQEVHCQTRKPGKQSFHVLVILAVKKNI